MFSKVLSAALCGVEAVPVSVEADISSGLPSFSMVGYLNSQVREAQDRVRTALRNAKLQLPPCRITINLSPADLRKEGSWFDLPIAVACLAAQGEIPPDALEGAMLVGELSLNGRVNPVPGVLPAVLAAREAGCSRCYVPEKNAAEARIVKGIRVRGVQSLTTAIRMLKGGDAEPHREEDANRPAAADDGGCNFSDLRGQESLKRAALIAAAGFHNLLMIGPPGGGKTMTAQRIPSILPPLTEEEYLEVTKVYSAAGLLDPAHPLMVRRPYRSPHHTITLQALAGGGRVPRPGEITLAHRGVLFLDELPEYQRPVIETLREPLERRSITIARSFGTYTFPADFLLVAAMNPCPCGFYPDRNRCSCAPQQIQRYQAKLSQPFLERIDLCAQASGIGYDEIAGGSSGNVTSKELRERVVRVWKRSADRFAGAGIRYNSGIPGPDLPEFCALDEECGREARRAFETFRLSPRAYHRILRVARTIADLDESERIRPVHLREAICFRPFDRRQWEGAL